MFQVIQNRESAELTTNGNIQTEVSTDGPQFVLHLQPMLYSVSGPQVIVSSGSAEFFTNGSQVSLYHKSVECLSSGLQVPASHEQSVCVATGGHLEQRLKITTCDSMSSDTNFVFPRVSYIAPENVYKIDMCFLCVSFGTKITCVEIFCFAVLYY